jgi:hypothetical protein
MKRMRLCALYGVVATSLLCISALPSLASTLFFSGGTTGVAPIVNTADLGTNGLQPYDSKPGSNEIDYFFTVSGVGGLVALNANASDTSSSGAGTISPFTLSLFDVTTGTFVPTTSTLTTNGALEFAGFSGDLLVSPTDEYELIVDATNNTTSISTLEGDIFLSAAPLPGALPLFASGLLGFWTWRKRRNSKDVVSLESARA